MVVFCVVAILPTLWVVLSPQTRLQAAIGTILASAGIGLLGWWFLRREGVRAADVGLGKRAWTSGAILFVAWWVAVTIVDLAGRGIARLLGLALAPITQYTWSPITVLELAKYFIFVGFGEEIAFRGYLHNKLIAVTGRRWPGILLAALLFGLWHVPAEIATQGPVLTSLFNGVLFALLGLAFFHLPYEWGGLLPFVALFHGWNDFLLLLTFQAPTWVGVVAGYSLVFVAAWVYRRMVKSGRLRTVRA